MITFLVKVFIESSVKSKNRKYRETLPLPSLVTAFYNINIPHCSEIRSHTSQIQIAGYISL